MPSGSDASRSSMSAYDKFMTPNFNSAKHGPVTDNIQGAIPFTVVDDKPLLHATAQQQDPISLSAIGLGLLSLVTMLGVHLRRRLQPSALGDNVMEMQSEDSHKMSSNRVGWGQLSAQNTRPSTLCFAKKKKKKEEESEDATETQAASTPQVMQAASTPQVAVAVAGMETQEDLKSLAKALYPTVGYWDPLSIGEESTTLWNYNNERKIAWFRQAEIKHGRVAMAAFVGYCVQANGST